MSRLPHFCSDSNFHRDEESSQSMSQVRARPAICLDKSLSFISTTSVPAGTMSGPASPLLGALGGDSANGACSSSSAIASPKLFHTRDVNVEASRQRSLQSFKASRSRAISGSRTAHSSSRPYSQQPPPPHHKRHHYPHPRSSCSPSVSRSCRVHSEARRGERSRCLAVEACCGALEVVGSEATVTARPSDPRPDGSDAEREPGVLDQRVMSVTVSPAPRHVAALSEDLEGVFSMPASEGEEEGARGGGGHCAVRSHGRGRASFNSDVREQDDADCVKRTSGATPPPRRALVLSHRCSDADTETGARAADAQPPRSADEAVERCASTCMATVDFAVDAPRGSTILVVGSGDEDEGRAFTDHRSITAIIAPANVRPLAAADASRAECPAVFSTLAVGGLFSSGGEGEGKDAPHGAALTAHRAAATERESVNSCCRSRGSESRDMTCPLPRPVPPSATVAAACPLSSPAHAREDEGAEGAEEARAVREDAIKVNEQQQEASTETALTNKAVNASVHTTTITAEASANTAQDLVSFSMDSSLLPASSTLQCALQATPAIPAQPDAPAALTAAANGESASVTPLSSFMMLNSISGPSLTAATTATSSLWLVSGTTPTPLRRLRDRGREVSATLDVEEGEVEEVSRGSATARAHTERALNPEGGASAAAVAAPETESELDRDVNRRSALAYNSTGAKQPIATAEEAYRYCRTSASPYTGAHSVASPSVSTPSFSPEPARPQAEAHHPSKLCLAARTAVSVQLNPLTANDDAVTSAVPQPPPAPGTTAAPHRYSTATHSPFATAGTCRAPVEVAPLISSPSSAESARVSEEVKELVRRAQAEVCRTRESLISALREHRVSFHLSEPSPTAKSVPSPTAPAQLAQSSVALSTALCASPNVSPAPARRLLLPTVAVTAAEPSMLSSAAPTTVSAPAMRTSGEWRSAATILRPQLRAAADAILRRLQGYDVRDHGVLPMDTVMRVTYFVVTRQQMLPAAWSLRTAEGALATTPMQVSMVASGGDATFRSEGAQLPSHNAEGRQVALVSGTPLGRQLSSSAAGKSRHCAVTLSPTAFETPCQQRFPLNAHDTVKHLSGSASSVPLSRPVDRTQPRGCSGCAADAKHRCKIVAAEHHGGPVTCTSPSRTLEHVMLLQQRRAEEELHLHFYFTVLEAFKQVFGERYAWRHLGATNASRHDGATNLTQPPQKRQRTSDSPVPGSSDRRGHTDLTGGEADAEHVPLEVTNEFNDVAGPLEALFPRLRQQYALIQREKRDTAATTPSSVEGGTGDPLTTPRTTAECARSEAGAPSMGPTHRPPPLDVLVYYRTYIESLREL
ncbi:hypothetical protein LSCM4_06887 [Leishmania orientalis]|uniref:Uncharacterized protein n=1 Tax=Leishmania orientalis TaxID=2249476 RepID=A0A836HPK1_9TRYP|nr:hypothetical protein LSCM4_06887 [Leishmania orientalis]